MNEKSGKNYFFFEDLVELLQEVHFEEDSEATLLQALLDLDDDGDGMIPKEEMITYLSSMGEAFSQEEIKDFLSYAIRTHPQSSQTLKTSEKETYERNGRTCQRTKTLSKTLEPEEMIDLRLLCKVMMPVMSAREEILKAAS